MRFRIEGLWNLGDSCDEKKQGKVVEGFSLRSGVCWFAGLLEVEALPSAYSDVSGNKNNFMNCIEIYLPARIYFTNLKQMLLNSELCANSFSLGLRLRRAALIIRYTPTCGSGLGRPG